MARVITQLLNDGFWWTDKQNMVHPHNGILFSQQKKEWSTDTCYKVMNLENIMSSEKSQTQKAAYYMKYLEQVNPHRQKVD